PAPARAARRASRSAGSADNAATRCPSTTRAPTAGTTPSSSPGAAPPPSPSPRASGLRRLARAGRPRVAGRAQGVHPDQRSGVGGVHHQALADVLLAGLLGPDLAPDLGPGRRQHGLAVGQQPADGRLLAGQPLA